MFLYIDIFRLRELKKRVFIISFLVIFLGKRELWVFWLFFFKSSVGKLFRIFRNFLEYLQILEDLLVLPNQLVQVFQDFRLLNSRVQPTFSIQVRG